MNLLDVKKISGAAAAVLLATSPAWAQIEINPNLDLSGYMTGSVRYFDDDFEDDTTFDLDATKLLATLKFEPVSGTFSYYWAGDSDPELLDAYITYSAGEASITAGKFLSWHGYEAFDIPNMQQITYSNDLAALIPGYHKGVKVDYASGDSKMGFAVLDSVYGSDGDIDDGIGLEAYYVYSADALTAYLGAGWESSELDDGEGGTYDSDSWLLDFWTSYALGSTTLAAELAVGSTDSDIGDDVDSYFWMLLAEFAASEKDKIVVRVSGGEEDYGTFVPEFLKGTLAWRHTCSEHFTIVSELSFTDFGGDSSGETTFLGVQGRFTF